MADMKSNSPVSDIHICGRCRVEFNDIYQFINHKKTCCGIKKPQPNPGLVQNSPTTLIDHSDQVSNAHHLAHHNHSMLQIENQSVDGLSYTTPESNGQSQPEQYHHNGQHPFDPDRNLSFTHSSDPHSRVISNIGYKSLVAQSESNNFRQNNNGNVTVDSNYDIDSEKSDHSRLDYNAFEVHSTNHRNSIQNSQNLDSNSGTMLPVTATATSQELLNSASGMGICSTSENTVDSSALCPEDLEVGQISEAMIGKLSQKFQAKGPALPNRKLNDSGAKRVGRLDPISTFTLRRKCDRTSTNNAHASKDLVTRPLPFSTDRINSSSVPIAADCDETESPIHRLDLKGMSFEKRDRLQGVSDDLLNQSPSTTMHAGNGVTSIRHRNVVENAPREQETYSTENVPKTSSVYKAVFTSPSCGGHRLSVKVPEDGNQSQLVTSTPHQSGKDGGTSRTSLVTNNCSTNYKNISKLADVTRNENVVNFEFENSNMCHLTNQDNARIELKAEELMCGNSNSNTTTSNYEEIVKEYSVNPQQLNYPAVKMSEEIYSSSSKCEDNKRKDSMNFVSAVSHDATALPETHNSSCSIAVSLTEMKTNTSMAKPIDTMSATEYLSWEPEEIQVMASTEQMSYLQWSRLGGDENKDIELSLKNENYSVEGDDTIVLVYKRDDGSLIMMCKPNGANCDGNNEGSLQVVAESVLSDGTVLHGQSIQDGLVHSVIQQSGDICVEYKNNETDKGIDTGSSVCDLKEINLQSCERTAIASSNANPALTTHNAVYSSSCGDRAIIDRQQETSSNAIVGFNDSRSVMVKQPRTSASDKIVNKGKGSSHRVRDKPLKELAIKSTCAPVAPVIPAMKCLVSDVKKTVSGSGSNKMYTCHFGGCRYSTKLGKDFQRHYRTHTGERPFSCDKCDKTFNRSDKLKAHLRCHAGLKPFACKICNYATTESGSLKKHMRIHNDERPFQCQICPYASRNSSQLVVHLRTHTGDAPFHCTHCSAQFKIKSDLKRHLRVHTGEKPFACDKCDYRCSNKGNLNIHHRINHSSENEKPCPQCNFVTSSMKRLREHIKIHDEARIIKCSNCQYTCNSSAALRSHMMVHNTLRPYRCTFCPYSSKQSGNLKKHVQNVHNERHRQISHASSSRSSSKHSNLSPSKSHRNGSSYRRRSKTREANSISNSNTNTNGSASSNTDSVGASGKHEYHHRPTRRPSSSRKIHVCSLCGCGFVRNDSLRCHLRQHSEKKADSHHVPKTAVKSNIVFPTPQTMTSSLSGVKLQPAPQQPLQLFPQPHQLPPPPLPAPSIPPMSYRNNGLDSIVAAASQLYREQYGEEDEDEEEVYREVLLLPNTTTHAQADTSLLPNTTTHVQADSSLLHNTTTYVQSDTSLMTNTTTYVQTDTNLLPSTTTHIHANTSLLPNTTTHIQNDTGLLPNTTTHVQADTSLLSNTTTHVQADTSLLPNTTTHVQADTSQLPNTSTFVQTNTSLLPNTSTHVHADTSLLPNTTTCVQADTSLLPNTTTLMQTDTSLLPSTTAYIQNSISLLPNMTTHICNDDTGLLPNTTHVQSNTILLPSTTTNLYNDTSLLPNTTTHAQNDTSLLPNSTTLTYSETSLMPNTTTHLQNDPISNVPYSVSNSATTTTTTTTTTTQNHAYNLEGDNLFCNTAPMSVCVPVSDVTAIQQIQEKYTLKSTSTSRGKRQRGSDSVVGGKREKQSEPVSKQPRVGGKSFSSTSTSKSCHIDANASVNVNASGSSNCQALWEHVAYTASHSGVSNGGITCTSTPHLPTTTATATTEMMACETSSPLLPLPSTQVPLSSSPMLMSSSSCSSTSSYLQTVSSKSPAPQNNSNSAPKLVRQQHRNSVNNVSDDNSSTYSHVSSGLSEARTPTQPQPPLHPNALTTYHHQYGTVTSSNMDARRRPISIQLVQQGTQLQHQSSSQMANSLNQNQVGSSTFLQQQQQQLQLQPPLLHHATTALQILVPAGTQMTQIIQPPPLQLQPHPAPQALQPPPGLPQPSSSTTQDSHQPLEPSQIMAQHQIVFQIQEAPQGAAPVRQEVVPIPTTMAAPSLGGQQVVLGQCQTFGLVENHVITAPADSTTMGSVYSLSDQRVPGEDTLT